MKTLSLDFGKRSYDICISDGFDSLAECIKKEYTAALIVTDSNIYPIYTNEIKKIIETKTKKTGVCVFEAGEKSKNICTIQKIYDACLENNLDRKSVIIALGGGVCGDMAGFAAATYMRGIAFIQIPTTLLAQTDSSVGGKVGIDYGGVKNIVGAFKQPDLVYINTKTLESLNAREFAAGMGEVIKYSFITDYAFIDWLCKNCAAIKEKNSAALEEMIYFCCKAKADVVCADETEKGMRMLLNFGHTIGHGIESAQKFSYLHGECVALGMICAMNIALERNMIKKSCLDKLLEAENCFGLLTSIPNADIDEILNYVKNDKKKTGSKISFVLPVGEGKADIFTDVTFQQMKNAIEKIIKSER